MQDTVAGVLVIRRSIGTAATLRRCNVPSAKGHNLSHYFTMKQRRKSRCEYFALMATVAFDDVDTYRLW